MNLDDLLAGTRGDLKNTKATSFSGVLTDSRLTSADKIFFALKGDVHDAHKFIPELVAKGVGAIVSHQWSPELAKLAQQTTWVQVADTLQALQEFSLYWRKKWNKTVVGITGSNGKTSVKDFTHVILSEKFNTLKSHGSFNNHWGVPLTLLSLREKNEIAIVEMGMNHSGEITNLCKLAEPNIVLVNNVGRAHMGNFKSLDEVASAKEEIYYGLSSQGIGVFNIADERVKKMYQQWQQKLAANFTFGSVKADVFFKLDAMAAGGINISGHIRGVDGKAKVPIWGEHNVNNLMAAACLSLACKMAPKDIWLALPKCQTSWGRNQWLTLKTGQSLLFDGYNANPDSFKVLLSNLNSLSHKQGVIAIFGEMLEQGSSAELVHEELGQLVALSSIDTCYFIGPSGSAFERGFMKNGKKEKKLIISYTYEESLALKIKSMLDTDTLVVVKGSRGGALERVVRALGALNFENK